MLQFIDSKTWNVLNLLTEQTWNVPKFIDNTDLKRDTIYWQYRPETFSNLFTVHTWNVLQFIDSTDL